MAQRKTINSLGLLQSPFAMSLGLIVIGVATTASMVTNHFVYDDRSIIVNNPAVHTLGKPAEFFNQPYWPAPYPRALYRPLATALLAGQWNIGNGRPWLFRVVSITLYIGVALALFQLGRLLLPHWAAGLAALVFIVHPVHVEAVSVAVNQSELIVGLLAVVMTHVYLKARSREEITGSSLAILFVCYVTAMLFKESGAILIAVLAAAELLIVVDPRSFPRRVWALRRLVLLLLLGAASVAGLRTMALGGDIVGTPIAEALKGLSFGDRALAMLAIVPEWARLLLWPAHLRGDYSPSEILAATAWGSQHLVGTMLVVAVGITFVICRRSHRTASFGLLWLALAIVPVSNVIVPTGVVLAERTLFLPSIGVVLVLGSVAVPTADVISRHRTLVAAATVGAIAILAMAGTRSVSRYRVWRDELAFWRQTIIDAPMSSRAHHALAQLLFQAGSRRDAEREYQLAIAFATTDWAPALDFADKLRLSGLCKPAVFYYMKALELEPKHEAARNNSIRCLLALGDYEQAGAQAREALRHASRPETAAVFRRLIEVSDSALRQR